MLLRKKAKDEHHGTFNGCSQCNYSNTDRHSFDSIACHDEIINKERGYGRKRKEGQGQERKTKEREVDA